MGVCTVILELGMGRQIQVLGSCSYWDLLQHHFVITIHPSIIFIRVSGFFCNVSLMGYMVCLSRLKSTRSEFVNINVAVVEA